MKLYYAMFLCAVSAGLTLLLTANAAPVPTESHPAFVAQPQITELVTMAIPPYKW